MASRRERILDVRMEPAQGDLHDHFPFQTTAGHIVSGRRGAQGEELAGLRKIFEVIAQEEIQRLESAQHNIRLNPVIPVVHQLRLPQNHPEICCKRCQHGQVARGLFLHQAVSGQRLEFQV